MVVLDASVWVAVLLTDEPRHKASETWLYGWMGAGRRIAVPALFVAEVGSAVARRRRNPLEGLEAIHDIRDEDALDIVAPSADLWKAAAVLAAERLIRGADAVYVAVAADLDLPLVTWDQEILTRAAGLVDARTPDQVPI